VLVCRLGLPPPLARRLAGFPAADLGAEPLVMLIARIRREPLVAVDALLLGMLDWHPAFSPSTLNQNTFNCFNGGSPQEL